MNRNAGQVRRDLGSLGWSGIFLCGLGLLHVPVWSMAGGEWEGAVSWRKPILFGISTGLTLCSLSWVSRVVTNDRFKSTCGWLVSISLVLEVLLITVQQWRGQASHFNRSTPLDGVIDWVMLILIVIAFLGIMYFFIKSMGVLTTSCDQVVALRSGMLFLVISCLIGFAISTHGYFQIEAGLSPEVYGERGVAKFPHGVTIHALQLLPAVAWSLRQIGCTLSCRLAVIRWLSASFGFQLLFASYQTLHGHARFEFSGSMSVGLAAMAFITAIGSFFVAFGKTCRHPVTGS